MHAAIRVETVRKGLAKGVLHKLALSKNELLAFDPTVAESDVPQLLKHSPAGLGSAAEQILPLVYDELRKLAAARLAREVAEHTLQPTALVHEAWLRLGGDQQQSWRSRAEFFAAAAEAMRRILIEEARRRNAEKRGGKVEKVRLNATGMDVAAEQQDDTELSLVSEALDNLMVHDPRKAELVKLWYFVGMTVEEAAEVLGISVRTAERDWAYARAWLVQEMDRLRR